MTLIVPAAAPSDTLPYIFEKDRQNDLVLYASISGIDLSAFNAIYITILQRHAAAYDIEEKLKESFERHHLGHKTHIIQIENSSSEPSTIAQTIEQCHLTDSFMVKDTDNFFHAHPSKGNYVCVYPLDQLKRVNPSNKSYVELDYNMYITNIIEKRIIGRYFCAGGYCFHSAKDFLKHYHQLSETAGEGESLYLSHVVFSMLLEGQSFRPILVDNYIDWGTREEWTEYKK